MLKTVSEAIEYRRSVRKYLEDELNVEKVKKCILRHDSRLVKEDSTQAAPMYTNIF